MATECYVSHLRQRPDCERLAVARYSPIALCADCDRRRPSAGKGMAPVALADLTTLVEVLSARETCIAAEEALCDAVTRARTDGRP
ncbi:MAG: hypothetical protein ACYC1D_17805 [Acidimicrobiales bacterium]